MRFAMHGIIKSLIWELFNNISIGQYIDTDFFLYPYSVKEDIAMHVIWIFHGYSLKHKQMFIQVNMHSRRENIAFTWS